jgi:RIO kinase 1
MEFKGENFQPYPKLKEVNIENPEKGFKQILDGIKQLWNEEKLVHGDLSEYNILIDSEGSLTWIDFAQGVHTSHPEAEEFLSRDIENLTNFFKSEGAEVDVEKSVETVLQG